MAHYWDQDRRLEARWRRLVREFADSRLGVREFCRVNGLKVSSLHFWHEEFRRRDRQPYEGVSEPSRRAGGRRTDAAEVAPPALPAFVSVRVDGPVVVGERMDGPSGGAGGRMEIELAGGRRVVLSGAVDRQVLADVVSVLEGLPVASSGREVSSC